MAEKKKYNSILISGRKDQTLTYSKYVKDEESGESVKESLDKKVNVTDELTTQQIKDGAITNEKMAAGSVGNTNLKDGSVSNEKLEDGSITNEKLAENSITKDKLQDKTIGVEKLNNELRQAIAAATGLPEDLVETIQNVDDTLKDHQSQLDNQQSQIDDKQQQITANDEDISLLQTRSTQMEETIKGIAATGGASQATAVTYDNEKSKLSAINIQSAVDEVVDKVAIKDENETVVETPFRYIQNEEFIFAKVDAEDKLLFGIQWDGTPVFGKTSAVEDRLQSQVTLLAERVSTIMGDEDTTNVIDTMNELKKFFAEIENTETLTGILANLDNVAKNLDKTTIKDEEGNVQDTPFRVIENEEFIMAVVDSEDRVLFGFYRATGKPYYPLNEMYHVEQNEEFLWVILDAANHPLLGIQQDGTCWAAKAKWLDDIKAIKEALSSIDETLKTFQTKEDGKGLINLDVADSFFYISNDEYIIAVVDAENRILAGIKYDGEPYFPNHEMYSVITNEEWLYAIIDAENKVLGGFRADDGHMVVGGIDVSTFISNAIIDIQDIKERTAHLSTIVNDEYLSVETDADGKVIGYTAPDGSHYLYNVKSETIPEEFSSIEDPEGRAEIIKDKENRIIGFVDSQGDFHANTNVFSKNIDNLQNVSDNFCLSSHHEDVDIVLEEPRIAEVRLYAKRFPSSKTSDIKGKMKFISGKTFFERNVLINLQGATSMTMPKKNISLDIMDSSYSDSLKVRFGDWVSQDSFHLKAYYFDLTKGVAPTAYMLYKQIEESNGFENDRPYKMYKKTILEGGADINDIEDSFNYDALCHPMGFPCVLYWNDEFYGLMSWQLKKHRDNYAMNKKNAKHIHLDGWIDKGTLFGGKVDWTAFEIRNPKSLVCSDGSSYDGENPKELIDDTMPSYDSTNKNHKNTMAVKKSIIAFSKYMSEIDAVIVSSPDDITTIKNAVEERFDVVRFMDYLLFIWATANTDSTAKNWQFLSYDGKKLTVEPYDLDSCWGIGAAMTGNFLSDKGKKYLFGTTDNPLQYIYRYYLTELKERWKVLRDKKIIDAENINNLYLGWYHRVGFDNIQKELKRWNESPCYRPIGLNESWELTGDSYVRFSTISTDWMPQNTYAENDKCKYNNRLYRSKSSGNINHIPTETEYWEDLTFVEGKTYHPNETCFWGYTSFFECKCKTETTSQPFKLYSIYPQELSNGFDSLARLYRYAKNTINYIDSQLDYKS